MKARRKKNEIIQDYSDVAEKAMNCLDEGFEDSMTVMALPKEIRTILRTSNSIERLNRELKRRSHVIGIFPNQESLIRLMGAVLMERNDLIRSYVKRVFCNRILQEVYKASPQLEQIAKEQWAALVA